LYCLYQRSPTFRTSWNTKFYRPLYAYNSFLHKYRSTDKSYTYQINIKKCIYKIIIKLETTKPLKIICFYNRIRDAIRGTFISRDESGMQLVTTDICRVSAVTIGYTEKVVTNGAK